jgi:hypothetical protein
MSGLGKSKDEWDCKRQEERIRVCLVLSLTLSVAFWGWIKKVGWGVSEPNRAVSHTAGLKSGQEAGVGRKGGWFFGSFGGGRRSLNGGVQR